MKKQITKKRPEGFIRINITTERNYFSITADLCSDSTFQDSKIHACGCLHEDILSVCPELKPFVDLHLSDLEGVPMHAVENGFYWLCKVADIPQQYGPDKDKETCLKYLCNHLRIPKSEAQFIVEKVQIAYELGKQKIAISEEVTEKCREEQHAQAVLDANNYFRECVDIMRPRWKHEAAQAIKLLESL